MVTDPVCGDKIDHNAPETETSTYAGKQYFFCSEICRIKFDMDPVSYIPENWRDTGLEEIDEDLNKL